MYFPRYWAKATHRAPDASGDAVEMGCWRWSDVSTQDAQAHADVAARVLVEKFIAEGRPPDSYGYANRPLREPVLRELTGRDGAVVGAITRNAHGCDVLNTTRAMFIDVDFDQVSEGKALRRASAFIEARPGWGMRVYRTAAGLRMLVTHEPIDSESELAAEVLEALGSDPLYRRLCALQKSFRARLTPKHWRCDVDKPPGAWPFEDSAHEAAFARWHRGYAAACESRRTCKLVRTLGSDEVHPDIQPILELHDAATGVVESKPLA